MHVLAALTLVKLMISNPAVNNWQLTPLLLLFLLLEPLVPCVVPVHNCLCIRPGAHVSSLGGEGCEMDVSEEVISHLRHVHQARDTYCSLHSSNLRATHLGWNRRGRHPLSHRIWLYLLHDNRACAVLRHGHDQPEEPARAFAEPAGLHD